MQNLTGEQLSGDLLTATLWSWFAATESHQRLSQNTAGVISHPGLSYGLFHAVVQPIYSFGIARQVKFPGVNIDIGHLRHQTWAKDNDVQKWVNYNQLNGQHMSALEHAVPERFFNDPKQCNAYGTTTPKPNLPDCPRGISSISALQIAASQGQRIYTITQAVYNANPGMVNTHLGAHSAQTQQRISEALNNGMEVTVHQSPISEGGWTGAGYIISDPATGSGAYEIEGGSRGAFVTGAQLGIFVAIDLGLYVFTSVYPPATAFPAYLAIILAGEIAHAVEMYKDNPDELACFWGGFFLGLGGAISVGAILAGAGLVAAVIGFLTWAVPGLVIPTNTALQCKAFLWQR